MKRSSLQFPFAPALALAALLGTLGPLEPAAAQSPELLFEEALYREAAAADPSGAVRAYRAVIDAPGVSPRLAARARLRLGVCLLLAGDEDAAGEQLAAVLAHPGADPELVRAARRYLRQPAPEDPARFVPSDVALYAEVVEPRENVRGLSALLEGTPFQNPVDYYVTELARRAGDDAAWPPPESTLRVVPEAAAFLNEGFLRELQKIEGLAVAVPGPREAEDDFLAVLLPGSSVFLRGLVQFSLTLSGASPVGKRRDMALFRFPRPKDSPGAEPDSLPHVALGADVILLGKPRRLVEDAVECGSGGGASLAAAGELQAARSSRQGGILFAYLGGRRVTEVLRTSMTGGELEAFEVLHAVLGLDRVRSAGITLTRSAAEDALHLEVRVRLDAVGLEAWRAFAAPALDGGLLGAVPPGALGFLAAKVADGPRQLDALRAALEPVLEALERQGQEQALGLFRTLSGFFAEEPGRRLVEEVAGVAVGLGDGKPELGVPPLFCVLEMRRPDAAGGVVEAALGGLFARFLQNVASRSFQDEVIEARGEKIAVRSVEPLPGVRFRCLRLGAAFVVSPSVDALLAARAAAAGGQSPAADALPSGSGKCLFLRPAALVQRGKGKAHTARDLEVVFREVPRLLVATRDGPDSLSLEVVVPDITPTARAVLTSLAETLKARRARAKQPAPGEEPKAGAEEE
ncbi:MAG: hypothetical protein HY721_05630 [Planctomycetes bacterium]|nr:hypothetical protein [Planctomycetota bacterium]